MFEREHCSDGCAVTAALFINIGGEQTALACFRSVSPLRELSYTVHSTRAMNKRPLWKPLGKTRTECRWTARVEMHRAHAKRTVRAFMRRTIAINWRLCRQPRQRWWSTPICGFCRFGRLVDGSQPQIRADRCRLSPFTARCVCSR